MAKTLSYTPPGRAAGPQAGPVRRRHVLYVPGYDPEAESRSRMLFVREFLRHAKRFGLAERAVAPVERVADLPGTRWQVRAAGADWATDTTFEVLRWDDIVQRDFARPVATRVALLLVGFLDSLVSGVMIRFFRLNWKFGGVILYPFLMICLLGVVGLGLGLGVARLLGALVNLPGWAGLAVVLALAAATFAAVSPLFERWFVWHLLHDWVFNWQHGNGKRADYEARVDRFAAHLARVARTSDSDEILVVGHSSGSVMAVEIVARALERDPELGARRPAVALLTIGSCLPLVALNPRARRCRDGIARILTSAAVLWVEYQAPQDWLNFSGFNPVRDLGLGVPEADCANPVIRSARFRETMDPATYRAILYRPFRMHFQFLMANARPGEYDYPMIVAGPLPLSERVRRPADVIAGIVPAAEAPAREGDDVLQRVLRPSRQSAASSRN